MTKQGRHHLTAGVSMATCGVLLVGLCSSATAADVGPVKVLPVTITGIDKHFTQATGPPVASFTYSPDSPFVGELVTFDASSSDDEDGTIIRYLWDIGGEGKQGKHTAHVFFLPGAHRVTLTVEDDDGLKDSASTSVVVSEDTEPPKTTHEFSGDNPRWVKVTFTAEDDLSGVARTMCSFDGGAWTEGTTFWTDLSSTTSIRYRSVDRQGNKEDPPKEICVEKREAHLTERGPICKPQSDPDDDRWVPTGYCYTLEMKVEYLLVNSPLERNIVVLDHLHAELTLDGYNPLYKLDVCMFGAVEIQICKRIAWWEFPKWRDEIVKTFNCSGLQKSPDVHTRCFTLYELDANLNWVDWDDDSRKYGVRMSLGSTISSLYMPHHTKCSNFAVYNLMVPPSRWGVTVDGTKALADEVRNYNVLVDPSMSEIEFSLLWEGSDFDLALLSPTTQRIDPNLAETDSDTDYTAGEAWEWYLIRNPQPGEWTAEICATDVPQDGEHYTLVAQAETELTLDCGTDKWKYDRGQPITISVTHMNSEVPMSDAMITAQIQAPDRTTTLITLRDDRAHGDRDANDGYYGNTFLDTNDVGDYEIVISAVGEVAGEPYSRVCTQSVSVVFGGDINLDGSVDYTDVDMLAGRWLCQGIRLAEDVDGNGVVDGRDLAILGRNLYQEMRLAPAPVAHWTFDEGSGDIAGDSAGANHGALYGATWTAGQINGALRFDGRDDYVDCGSSHSLAPETMTLAFWVRPQGNVSYQYILGKAVDIGYSCDYRVSTSSGGQLEFRFGEGMGTAITVRSSSELVADQWSHVAVVRAGSVARLYLNGELEKSGSYSFAPTHKGHTLRIGSTGTSEGWAGYFEGKIDDVRIYDFALSDTQIEQLYRPAF